MMTTKQPTRDETQELTLNELRKAVSGSAAAFRCRTKLQPAGGEGTKVFPPTYAGAVYATEKRRLPERDQPVECVLIDSVQSQANRFEAALQDAVDGSFGKELKVTIPVIEVDFSGFAPGGDASDELRLIDTIGRVTSLQAPHRLADAILRDSVYRHNNTLQPFRRSEIGRSVDGANARNATPLYELCPTALIFGMWDSTGPKGGLGAKFERAMTSEIVGVGCPYSFSPEEVVPKNRGVRNDPLGIRAAVRVKKQSLTEWEVAEDPKAKGTLSPAEINHSNVPFAVDNVGVTIEYAEQTTVLSLPALRRLRFPLDGQPWESTEAQLKRDDAAQTVLAALALCAAELSSLDMDLRSRCLLWPEGPRRWQLLDQPGEEPKEFTLGPMGAVKLLAQAVEAAQGLGLKWRPEPVRLIPSEQLVKLVRKSQEQAAVEGAAEGDD